MIAKPTLHNEYLRRDGTCVIKIYIYLGKGNEKRISTPYYVNPKTEWDYKENRVKKTRANYEFINAELKRMCYELEQEYIKGARDVKQLTEKPGNKITFRTFIEDYLLKLSAGKVLNKNGQALAPNTVRTFPTYTNYLFSYFDHKKHNYNFNEINTDFYHDFIYYLRHNYNDNKGLSENTIVKAIKTVKALMEKAKKHHDNKDFKDLSMNYIDVDNIYLTDKEVEKIVNLDLTGTPHLETERDRFIIAYNFLLRYTDSIQIDKTEIKQVQGKYLLDFQTQKTKTKVIVPVFKKTMEVLERYNYSLPVTTNQESNWKLKEIGKLAGITETVTITEIKKGRPVKVKYPKYKLISTHTSRRSMATNMYLSNIDEETIMLLGGWRSIIQFRKYLKIDKLTNAVKVSEHAFFKDK